jgi:hypothetical protein
MTALGYGRPGKPGGRRDARARSWARSTVGDVESSKRELTVDELIGLAMVLGVTIGELLNPGDRLLALGDVSNELEPQLARPFLRSDIALKLVKQERLSGTVWEMQPVPVEGRIDQYYDAIGVTRKDQ